MQILGLNRDQDMIDAVTKISGKKPYLIWQNETTLPAVDLIIIPGGFSYGDYLRCGAIAARMPAMRAVKEAAMKGCKVVGVCNGFQILIECGLLPGALLPNKCLTFVSHLADIEVVNNKTAFTHFYKQGQQIRLPIAHHDGNYFLHDDELKRVQDNQQIVFCYKKGSSPNGSVGDIAGVVNEQGNVLGMMPHPENYIEWQQGGSDGRALFEAALQVAS